MSHTPPHLFVIAGEPSGDRLGASLMAGLKTLEPNIRFSGVGGPLMQAEGLQSLFPMSNLSVMGLLEVLPRLPKLLRRVSQTTDAVATAHPDALITIDSPDFCLRVAGKARAALPDLRTIHYVAPTVWAWRPERAAKMAKTIDHVLALFPFEPPYMEAEGMTCDFVGHPVAADPVPSQLQKTDFRKSHGIADDEKMLLVLPGSRQGEVKRMAPVFTDVLHRVVERFPETRPVIPATANVGGMLEQLVEDWPGNPILLDARAGPAQESEARKALAFATADLALATSGTVSLELAAAGTPMVIAYRLNWLSTRIVKKKVNLKWATLVNILIDQPAVPEFLFEKCQPNMIAAEVVRLLSDAKARQTQITSGAEAIAMLGHGGEAPGLCATRSVLKAIQ